MIKPSMPGMAPRRTGHIFQCLSVLLASCPLSLLTSCACQGSKPPLSRKRPQHPTNPQALSCFSPLLCRWKSFLFGSLPFDFQVPADRIYWLSCSGDTVVEGPKKLGTANLASWYYNQQTPKSTLLSVSTFGIWPDLFSAVVTDVLSHQPAFKEFVQIHGWVSKAFTKKTLQMFKWFRNSQLTLFAWPSPYKAW